MIDVAEEYLVDENGNRKAVVIPIDVWQRIQEELEDLEDVRAYDHAKSIPSDAIPLEQAIREIKSSSE